MYIQLIYIIENFFIKILKIYLFEIINKINLYFK
jgi:hypothetical protein